MVKKLVVLAGPDEGRVFPLAGDAVLLGRSRATETHLLDPHVSRVHCQILPEENGYVLVDFESAGGTFVNGKAVDRHLLKAGDLIRIGQTRLQYVEDEGAAPRVDGAPPRAANAWAQDLLGQTLGAYEIGSPLARGRSGIVFSAQDTKRSVPVAVKVLRPEFGEDEQKVQHFVEAMKAVLPLRHANLLKVLGAGKTGPHLWVAMEYIAGDNLAAVISRSQKPGKIDPRIVVRLGVYMARALEYAHDKKLVHQNVTPQNILITKQLQDAKLTDLMLAIAVEDDPRRPISAAGTPSDSLAYLAPERLDDTSAPADPRTDIYSLGATLYAMLIGKPPFQGETVDDLVEQIKLDSPPRLTSFELDIAPSLDRLLRHMLAKRLHDRPASAEQLRKQLETLAQQQALPVPAGAS